MQVKKLIRVLFVVGLLVTPLNVAAAQGNATNPVELQAATGENPVTVSFADMGYSDTDLSSPFDSTSFFFSIPPNWKLVDGSVIELNFDVVLSGSDVGNIVSDQRPYGGFIAIRFNRQLIDTIYLDKQDVVGDYTRTIQIPSNALMAARRDGRHELEITLDASFSCIYDIRTLVHIKSTSTFTLPYTVVPPQLDLANLPMPFYMRNSLVPDRTLFVVPDDPETGELQAMLNTVAGFGTLVAGPDYGFDVTSISQLTNTDMETRNLVFIGMPKEFDLLSTVQFSVPISGGEFTNLLPDAGNDGIVQLAPSPWNGNKTVLLIGGNTPEAVNKAARAVSSGNLFIAGNPTLVYVNDVQLFINTAPAVEDFNLEDLGYQTQTLSGVGLDSVEFLFNVSQEQVATQDGYVELSYYHSGLMEYGTSSFTISLNDQDISSNVFTKDSVQVTQLQIKIPKGILKVGTNRLQINASMVPSLSCDTTGFSDPWFTISNQTKLHIPVSQENVAAPLLRDFKFYPSFLTSQSDFGDVAFILSKANPSNWNVAAQLTYQLSRVNTPVISNLSVAYADDVPENIREDYSMVVVGRASQQPFLTELNNSLPAPFDQTNDTASERQMQVIYRIPPGVSVGYLELLASPYNTQKTIIVVSGNDDPGVEKSGSTLIQGELQSQLSGVFAVTNGLQVVSSGGPSQFSVVGNLIPEAPPVVTTPIPDQTETLTTPVKFERPAWLPAVLLSLSVVTLIFIAIAIFSSLARRKVPKVVDMNETEIDMEDDNLN